MMKINPRDLFDIGNNPDINDKALSSIFNAIKEAQQNDFDYIKFKQSNKSLIAMGMDQETATKSAFLTATTVGLTKEKLMNSINHYLGILNGEKFKFAETLKNQINRSVETKSSQVQEMKARIEENKRKIEQLQKEIQLLENAIEKHVQEAEEASQKIDEVRIQFNRAFDLLHSEMKKDMSMYDKIL